MEEADPMKESVLLHVVEEGRPPINIITSVESVEHDMYVIHYVDDRLDMTPWMVDVRRTSHRLYDSLDSYLRDRFHMVIQTHVEDEDD
jgi:hypothetical protein